jgi:hypothetical protein
MSARTVTLLLLAAFVAGCAANAPPAADPKSIRPAPPATAPTTAASIPILYVYPAETERISQTVVDALLQSEGTKRMARDGARPWFISVHENRQVEGGQFFRIMLYFSPDTVTDRVRTGRFLLLWWYTGDDPSLRNYVQVSHPDRPFTARLELPAIVDLPFELEHYSNDPPSPNASEWVAFLDFSRPLLAKGLKLDETMPPYVIGRKNGNRYVVATGTDNGGGMLISRRTANGFKVDYEDFWSHSPWGDFPE